MVRERQKIEAQILTKNGERLTVNKAVKNYMKAASAMTNAAHDKEIEAAHLENELSRIRVDTLNTEAHNVQLREMMQKQLTELQSVRAQQSGLLTQLREAEKSWQAERRILTRQMRAEQAVSGSNAAMPTGGRLAKAAAAAEVEEALAKARLSVTAA